MSVWIKHDSLYDSLSAKWHRFYLVGGPGGVIRCVSLQRAEELALSRVIRFTPELKKVCK